MDGGIVKGCTADGEIVRIRINRLRGAKFRICFGKFGQIVKIDGNGGGGMFRKSILMPLQQAILKGITKGLFVGG